MIRRSSHHPIANLALVMLAAGLLTGCGASRGLPAGAPVMRPSGGSAVRMVGTTRPMTTPTTSGAGATHAGFLTQLGATSPAFSPRGDRLCFTTPSRGVLVAGPDGQNPQPLAGSLPGDREPAWSPNGDAIAVVRAGGAGGTAIVAINVITGQVSPIFQGATSLHAPAWLPAGRGLVFVAEEGMSTLERLDTGSATPAPLWQGPLADSPTVSPDGMAIVFARKDASGASGLARIAPTGGAAQPLQVLGANPGHPAFSASGRTLAYVCDDGLYLANADGSASRRVSAGTGLAAPAWNPGAPAIVVAATQGSRTDLERVALPSR